VLKVTNYPLVYETITSNYETRSFLRRIFNVTIHFKHSRFPTRSHSQTNFQRFCAAAIYTQACNKFQNANEGTFVCFWIQLGGTSISKPSLNLELLLSPKR